jgi:hypothetical protein
VHISQSDCKAEITARLEFKASWRGLVIFLCFTHIELVFLLQLIVETMCARVSAITFKHPAGLASLLEKCSVFDSFCPVTEVFVVLLAKSNDWFGGYVWICGNCFSELLDSCSLFFHLSNRSVFVKDPEYE